MSKIEPGEEITNEPLTISPTITKAEAPKLLIESENEILITSEREELIPFVHVIKATRTSRIYDRME